VHPRQGYQLPRSRDPHSRLHSQQLKQICQVHSSKLNHLVGVNFTNILLAPFLQLDLRWSYTNLLIKLIPCWCQFHQHFASSFFHKKSFSLLTVCIFLSKINWCCFYECWLNWWRCCSYKCWLNWLLVYANRYAYSGNTMQCDKVMLKWWVPTWFHIKEVECGSYVKCCIDILASQNFLDSSMKVRLLVMASRT